MKISIAHAESRLSRSRDALYIFTLHIFLFTVRNILIVSINDLSIVNINQSGQDLFLK
jgi:hypothetical protein